MQFRPVFLTAVLSCLNLMQLACSSHEVHAGIPAGPEAYDQRFLIWLVNHHNDDDRMVHPCAKKETIRKELREFCISVDQQHRQRVERMQKWLKDWYSEELPPTDNLPLWLGSLDGQEFEKEFFKEYEHQHADAGEPIKDCARKATHSELRDLCKRIVPGQQKQVAQLRKWRCEWFKDCG
jgi:uncharacterized protein (DUF305 family)